MISTPKTILIYWVPLFLYCLLIFIQSSYPSPESIPTFTFSDKLLHLCGYSLLGVLFYRAFNTVSVLSKGNLLIILSVLCTGLYGASDEIHQYFVPGRHANVTDFIADFFGGVAGVLIYRKMKVNSTHDHG